MTNSRESLYLEWILLLRLNQFFIDREQNNSFHVHGDFSIRLQCWRWLSYFNNCNIFQTELRRREYTDTTRGYCAVFSYTGALIGIWKSTAFEFIGPCVPRSLQPRLAVTSGRTAHGAAWGRGRITIISTGRKIQRAQKHVQHRWTVRLDHAGELGQLLLGVILILLVEVVRYLG